MSMRWKIATALGLVYALWGSTYLAIRFAVETWPPFLMGGLRFIVAGSLLGAFMVAHHAPRPRAAEWRSALVIGFFLLLGGNGCVVWAERRVPSGLTAV